MLVKLNRTLAYFHLSFTCFYYSTFLKFLGTTCDVTSATKEPLRPSGPKGPNRPRPWCLTYPAPHAQTHTHTLWSRNVYNNFIYFFKYLGQVCSPLNLSTIGLFTKTINYRPSSMKEDILRGKNSNVYFQV